MGGVNTKALVMINKLYPLGEGETIPEIKGVDPNEMREEEENCQDYGDEDEAIDKYTDEVWNLYDKKGEKFLKKKDAQQFFKDALAIFALRKNKKPKEILGQTKEGDALNTAFNFLAKKDKDRLHFSEFKDFVNYADNNDIIALLTGNTQNL
eukprot:TRINITY_DN2769_c0_g2_i1.p1 TRINITY_DN2769_c0_g2~~TRINITY_DN2769_c0_g2_i1.p1  ORF type:complete len:152 (+),score=54.02 TRINITY_DN2769_c0_g2_i1:163-618(+)